MPTLYVTEAGARVETEAGRVIVSRDGEIRLSLPAIRVARVVLVGQVGITTPALHLLLERGCDLVVLGGDGAFRGRLGGARPADVVLRRAQYRRADDAAFCLGVARALVAGKLRNARTLVLRWDETNADPIALTAAARLAEAIAKSEAAPDLPSLRGIEGSGARAYFDAVRGVIAPPWAFVRRGRRPPPDPVNCLLSVAYTLLHEGCLAALEVAGLDPWCGLYHEDRPGRAGLAIDLMEEFRPVVADSVVLTLLNNRMVDDGCFRSGPKNGVYLTPEGWRIVAGAYGKRLATLVTPPGLTRRISYQKLLEVQARKLARAIRDGDLYEPFLAK